MAIANAHNNSAYSTYLRQIVEIPLPACCRFQRPHRRHRPVLDPGSFKNRPRARHAHGHVGNEAREGERVIKTKGAPYSI